VRFGDAKTELRGSFHVRCLLLLHASLVENVGQNLTCLGLGILRGCSRMHFHKAITFVRVLRRVRCEVRALHRVRRLRLDRRELMMGIRSC
jgi:hypothetical protein